MQLSHSRPVTSAVFDDRNLVSCAGLVPIVALAERCALARLADEHLSVPTDKGAHAGAKVSALVAGMVAGADSIDDMALLRHGAMGTVFDRPYAPSTLGSFLREFAFGHVRQLDAVASRFLSGLHARTPLLDGINGPVLVDLDDTIIEVHGYAKQGSGYGYTRVRGLNALIATVTTAHGAPVITGQRLRRGSCGSPRGAARIIGDTLATVRRLRSTAATGKPLLRADSAFYGHPTAAAAIRGGAEVSITVRMDTANRLMTGQWGCRNGSRGCATNTSAAGLPRPRSPRCNSYRAGGGLLPRPPNTSRRGALRLANGPAARAAVAGADCAVHTMKSNAPTSRSPAPGHPHTSTPVRSESMSLRSKHVGSVADGSLNWPGSTTRRSAR